MFNKGKIYILAILASLPVWLALGFIGMQIHDHFQQGDLLFQTEKAALLSMPIRKNYYQSMDKQELCPYELLADQLANFPLLQEEKQNLQKVLQTQAFSQNDVLQKRLHFINTNQIKLINIQNDYRLDHPVAMNKNDLKKLLSFLEHHHPQYYLTHLSIKNDEQYLIVNFSLASPSIKREL